MLNFAVAFEKPTKLCKGLNHSTTTNINSKYKHFMTLTLLDVIYVCPPPKNDGGEGRHATLMEKATRQREDTQREAAPLSLLDRPQEQGRDSMTEV